MPMDFESAIASILAKTEAGTLDEELASINEAYSNRSHDEELEHKYNELNQQYSELSTTYRKRFVDEIIHGEGRNNYVEPEPEPEPEPIRYGLRDLPLFKQYRRDEENGD